MDFPIQIHTIRMGLFINSIARINLDLKQIQLNNTINDNALWVVEQIPSLVDYGDMAPILREGKIYLSS